MAVAASITALFLRGFKFEDLPNQFTGQNFETPAMKVWLVQSQPYADKMEAYRNGMASANESLGVYVISVNNQWHWVAGAYMTQEEANSAIENNKNLSNAVSVLHEVKSKTFKISSELITPCRQMFDNIISVTELLFRLRDNIINNLQDPQILLDLTEKYNAIKNSVQELQTLNATQKNELLASFIYTGNVNILSLQEVVCGSHQNNLSTINTAILKIIFSLDNF